MMPRLEHLKEDIAFEKQIFYILMAAGFAIIGWLFTNAEKLEIHLIHLGASAAVADGMMLAFLGRRVKNKIKEIESL